MSISAYDPLEDFLGAGNLASYTFDFKITDPVQLLVVVADDTGLEVQRVRGDDTTYLSSVTYDAVNGGGTVNLLANLPTDYRMLILQANDMPTQPSQFRNKFDFTLSRIEDALDFLASPIQRLAYIFSRTFRLSDFDDPVDFNPMIPQGLAGKVYGLAMTNVDGTGWASPSEWLTKPDLEAAEAAAIAAADSAAASAAAAADSASSAGSSAGGSAAAAASALAAATSETNAAASAAAAAVSETNAAASAVSTAADVTSSSTYAANASASAVAAAASAASIGTSVSDAAASAAAAAASAAAAAASAASVAAPSVTGSRASPSLITAAGGVGFTGTNYENIWFIAGNAAPIDVSANPQIAAATNVGQKLELIGRDDTNTVYLEDGTGLSLNGAWTGEADRVLGLRFDGTNWVETYRR